MSVWIPASGAWRRDDPALPDLPGDAPVPTLFLDRDGVVIEDRHYLSDPDGVALIPGAAAAMRRAAAAGFRLVGLSNQSGIGRGYYAEADFAAVQERVDRLLAESGAGFDAFLYCPHAPGDGCACRKPRTGLLDEAARIAPWAREGSWMVGDKAVDAELAGAAGLGAVLVLTGQGAAERAKLDPARPCRVEDDLAGAVARILGERRS